MSDHAKGSCSNPKCHLDDGESCVLGKMANNVTECPSWQSDQDVKTLGDTMDALSSFQWVARIPIDWRGPIAVIGLVIPERAPDIHDLRLDMPSRRWTGESMRWDHGSFTYARAEYDQIAASGRGLLLLVRLPEMPELEDNPHSYQGVPFKVKR